jgi:hypothetical protein
MNFAERRIFRAMLGLGCCLPALIGSATAQTGGQQEGEPEIIVTGSRIPRAAQEGPAPVTTITADTIRANGYTSVPDILRAVTQNGGETQSQQSFSGASFTPGAQQVDLRGLGPNHTLVLVNGRRIADFPLPFQGRSNFTDISNIPLGLIDQVEVLSGSASAIYGSDAIAGVINFKLKDKVDGTTIDYRAGRTEHGGGASHRITATTGWSNDRFHIVAGGEYLLQRPIWAYQRKIQDSTPIIPPPPRPSPGAPSCGTIPMPTNMSIRAQRPVALCPASMADRPIMRPGRATAPMTTTLKIMAPAISAAATRRSAMVPSFHAAKASTASHRPVTNCPTARNCSWTRNSASARWR